jgi:DNA repair exonuclease SbcCD ATPase subunit
VNFPNFPTDNLYKFMALTGLVLCAVCLFYPFFSLESEIRYSSRAAASHKALAIDMLSLKESEEKLLDKLTKVVQSWQKMKDELSASLNSPTRQNAPELKERMSALESEQTQLGDQLDTKQKTYAELEKREAALESDERIANEAFDQAGFYRGLCLFGDFVGLITCFSGFLLWYRKLQRYQDEIIALEARATRKQKPAVARRASKRPGRSLATSN